jgi:hypothetical protein
MLKLFFCVKNSIFIHLAVDQNILIGINIITEEYGVQDRQKVEWMSKYAQVHSLFEAQQSPSTSIDGGIYATPLNTLGIGNPMMPQANGFERTTGIGNTGADFHNPLYQRGSGDIPMSTLPMSLEIAAVTIGLELVPVIPSTGPWTMLTYFDTPYAGGKLGQLNETWADGKGVEADNKPMYIKFLLPKGYTIADKKVVKGDITVTGKDGVFEGTFIGFSRIDNSLIVEVKSCMKGSEPVSIADVFEEITEVELTGVDFTGTPDEQTALTAGVKVAPQLVSVAADFQNEFSNFAKREGKNNPDPMTRAENETGTGNTIGARMFSKMVQMGSYEVTGTVTRQQLQDMPLYGIDVVGKVLESMQNQISQSINNRILDRIFKLGVTNAKTQKDYQNVDLNLYFGDTPVQMSTLTNKYVDIHGNNYSDGTLDWEVKNVHNTSAQIESSLIYAQRRIMSRLLAAANLIASVSRRGRGQFAVTNAHILSALQDNAAFVVAPMVNTLTQNGQNSLYFAGSVAGLNLYVDPYMTWEDNRVCVGRKSNGKEPGVIFMPYILADTVQTIAEGTMAPKLLVNSRFAIVDAGFYPEQSYYTFVVGFGDGYDII